MEKADSSIMPDCVYYQKCGVMSQKMVIYKEHAASVFLRRTQRSLWTVGSNIRYLHECKTILIFKNTPKYIPLAKRIYIYLNIRWPSKYKICWNKHFIIIMPLFSSHPLLKFPLTSRSFHIISSVPFITLNIQHILKPFTVTSGEMHCHAAIIHID
jgi:hypothetical protein